MKTHDLRQGTPEWAAYRATHFNASDAPAMLGVSPYKTRAQLLRELHTGVPTEVDAGTQKRFDNGHRLEALARPLAEELIGQELYPVVGSLDKHSASFDGLTLDETIGFEHKALNDELRAAFTDIATIAPEHQERSAWRSLPVYHRAQMEQQIIVSGAERILFMTSDWDAEGNLLEEHHCWYFGDPKMRADIIAGWAQFERDLAQYKLPATAEAAPVGKAPDTLPALRIEVTGQVTASNLAEFKQTALAAIRGVNRKLATDQDFADAEKAVKWCAEVESRLKAAKEHALSQTSSIDELFKALDDISAEARTVRLDLDKLVTRRKAEVKDEAVSNTRRALDEHISALNGEIAPMRLKLDPVDFASAIKGLKSVASIDDKLGAALATAKIAADSAARVVRSNVAAFNAEAAGLEFLFADLGQVVHKASDDFLALVRSRIAAHKEAEEAKARQRAEAEARAAEQRRQAEEAASRAAAEAAAKAAESSKVIGEPSSQQVLKAEPSTADATARETTAMASPRGGAMGAGQGAAAPPVADEPATLKLGDICGRLGFTMTAAFLADVLHISAVRTEGRAALFTETQFRAICRQLVSHVSAIEELYAGEPA